MRHAMRVLTQPSSPFYNQLLSLLFSHSISYWANSPAQISIRMFTHSLYHSLLTHIIGQPHGLQRTTDLLDCTIRDKLYEILVSKLFLFFIFYILYFIFYILYFIFYILYFIFYILYFIFYILYFIFYYYFFSFLFFSFLFFSFLFFSFLFFSFLFFSFLFFSFLL